MKKLIAALLVSILGLAFAVNTYADPPHGKKNKDKSHKVKVVKVPTTAIVVPTGTTTIVTVPDKRPPGWDRGKKTGWGASNVPPGLAKKGVTTPTTITDSFLYNWFGITPVKDNVKPATIIKRED
jgi:hypothetical protein